MICGKTDLQSCYHAAMQIIVSLNRVRCGSYVQAPLMGVLFIQ